MYFLRRAHDLYKDRPQKSLSPSFWECEGKPPLAVQGIDAIMSGIEHPLGTIALCVSAYSPSNYIYQAGYYTPPGMLQAP
jgi:hypothetical protein